MLPVLSFRLLLRPADFETSVRFYEDVVGLARSRDFGALPRRGVVYALAGGELELAETPEGEDAGPRPEGVRLWLRVPDARAACKDLAERGAPVTDPPATKPWGLVEGSVADPDGLEIVLVEAPVGHPLRSDPR